jgi:hypothetical protein
VDWRRPAVRATTYKNMRWRSLTWGLLDERYRKYLKYYAAYLCKEWNAHHPNAEHLTGLRMYFMHVTTSPDYEISEPKKVLLYNHSCRDSPP